jgi:hypothetical protein
VVINHEERSVPLSAFAHGRSFRVSRVLSPSMFERNFRPMYISYRPNRGKNFIVANSPSLLVRPCGNT